MVIVNNNGFIDQEHPAHVDNDKYVKYIKNLDCIHCEALKFLKEYIDHITGNNQLDKEEFNRRYTYSPLQYFHNKLGI